MTGRKFWKPNFPDWCWIARPGARHRPNSFFRMRRPTARLLPPACCSPSPTSTARSWAIRDNQSYGEWEPADLSVILRELADQDLDLDLLGFREDELDALLREQPERGGSAPPPDPKVTAKLIEAQQKQIDELKFKRAKLKDALYAAVQKHEASLVH